MVVGTVLLCSEDELVVISVDIMGIVSVTKSLSKTVLDANCSVVAVLISTLGITDTVEGVKISVVDDGALTERAVGAEVVEVTVGVFLDVGVKRVLELRENEEGVEGIEPKVFTLGAKDDFGVTTIRLSG